MPQNGLLIIRIQMVVLIKYVPSPDLRTKGYLPDAEPTAQELNWQLNNLYLQIEELKAVAGRCYCTDSG